jgi:hypothetical protein
MQLSCTINIGKRRKEHVLLTACCTGGQFRGDGKSFISQAPNGERVIPSRGQMTIPAFNKEELDIYLTLIMTIEKVADQSTMKVIKAESSRIIHKLKATANRRAWDEVDFGEHILIAKRILFFWSMGEPVGTTAFIPPLVEAEEISKVLQDLTQGALERERILEKYAKEFGPEGRDIVADILSRQTAKANEDVPLINRFLEDLFQKVLATDVDLTFWDLEQYLGQMETSGTAAGGTAASASNSDTVTTNSILLLYFGCAPTTDISNMPTTWYVSKELSNAPTTSYEASKQSSDTFNASYNTWKNSSSKVISKQRPALFSKRQQSPGSLASAESLLHHYFDSVPCGKDTSKVVSKPSHPLLSTLQKGSIASAEALLINHFGPPCPEDTSNVLSKPRLARLSKLQKLGKILKEGLEQAAAKRHQSSKQADLASSQLREGDDEVMSKITLERCRRAAQSMEEVLFRQGSFKRTVATLRFFETRLAIREAKIASNAVSAAGDKSVGYETKSDMLNQVVRKSLRAFYDLFKKTKGPRLVEDQNCVDTALAALASTQIKEERLGRELQRAIGVTRRHLKRAFEMRSSLEDGDAAHWVRSPTREYSSSIKNGKNKSKCETEQE